MFSTLFSRKKNIRFNSKLYGCPELNEIDLNKLNVKISQNIGYEGILILSFVHNPFFYLVPSKQEVKRNNSYQCLITFYILFLSYTVR